MPELVVAPPEANPYGVPGTQNADKTIQQGPTPKLFAGKYKTEQELEQGHEHLQHTLTERTNELEAERNLRHTLEQTLEAVAERMSPADRVRSRSQAEETLESQGLPLAALEQYINERITSGASRVLDEKLRPLTQGAQTQQMLEDEFPDISRTDVDQFLRSNPEIRARYTDKLRTDVGQAMYFAYAQFARAGGTSKDLSGQAEQQAQARRDAALPSGQSGNREGVEDGPSLGDLFDNYLNRGDKTSFLLKRLDHIPGIKPQTR